MRSQGSTAPRTDGSQCRAARVYGDTSAIPRNVHVSLPDWQRGCTVKVIPATSDPAIRRRAGAHLIVRHIVRGQSTPSMDRRRVALFAAIILSVTGVQGGRPDRLQVVGVRGARRERLGATRISALGGSRQTPVASIGHRRRHLAPSARALLTPPQPARVVSTILRPGGGYPEGITCLNNAIRCPRGPPAGGLP